MAIRKKANGLEKRCSVAFFSFGFAFCFQILLFSLSRTDRKKFALCSCFFTKQTPQNSFSLDFNFSNKHATYNKQLQITPGRYPRGVITLTRPLSRAKNYSGNLAILSGIGRLGTLSGKCDVVQGHPRKKWGHWTKFVFR